MFDSFICFEAKCTFWISNELNLYNKVFVANSALEALNCTVFGDFKWIRKYFPHSSLHIHIFYSKIFFWWGCLLFCLVDCTCLVLLFFFFLFFLLFGYIWIENGMTGFTSLCHMLARFKVFFQARIDLTRPEYCRT